MKHFWNWSGPTNQRVLTINGTIAQESWLDDEITPQLFQDELNQGEGPVELWINSPGGDCIAASQIYTMLMNYGDDVNVKIDGVAASAASVIAMAGTTVSMAPTAMLMIHNPLTLAKGEAGDMQKAIQLLNETKESIINAYELKTGLPREKISAMMDDQTWMNVNKAIQLGFADEMLGNPDEPPTNCYTYSDHQADLVLLNKLKPKTKSNISVKSLQRRLSLLGH
ncbi:head maturation protease, ClpP-related [Lactobacillus delbrueckii subsp. allosunkii]|uniref:head maturation protease, ClpP-related n=1 Tax=Lactobacillus delbrueckii TaxID=1584 RepID=UPI0022A6E55B|nr:head maturation protease, ClpP-related [Lactobacillus delbrueckii]MCZ0787720.1 Clp protease ClpP [Lactobacillus delbrueckii subsp. sunkii]